MKKATKKPAPLVHLIGIGGIGMSSLARWFLAQNWAVSGSDTAKSSLTAELIKEGAQVKIGHTSANVPTRASLVVYSQAITSTDPERAAARRFKMRIYSYPEMIARLTREYATIAIAGAHGKSTTTALVALILARARLDPTVILGTKLREFGGKNFRVGKGPYLVLEADEYGKAFLHYSPALAAITTIDAEHLDTYGTLQGVKKSFLEFISNIAAGGALVLNRDDTNLFPLARRVGQIAKRNDLKVIWYSLKSLAAARIKKIIRVPGTHNISNALAALHLARLLNVPDAVSLKVIGSYTGSWRRLELRGAMRCITDNRKLKFPVYDDYAHHPTEIRATLAALKEKYPKHNILCVFQPHQAERLKRLFEEFQKAFDIAHMTLILPVYRVKGRDGTEHPLFNSRELVRSVQKKQPKKLIFYLENPKNLKEAIATLLTATHPSRAVIVMMGAGDIVDYTDALIRR